MYFKGLPDGSARPADMLPPQDAKLLFRLYALLLVTKGPAVSALDVHNAWAV
jgi:hypothetical protein